MSSSEFTSYATRKATFGVSWVVSQSGRLYIVPTEQASSLTERTDQALSRVGVEESLQPYND